MKKLILILSLVAVSLSQFHADGKTDGGKIMATYKGTHSFELGGDVDGFGIPSCIGGPVRRTGFGAYFEYRYAFAEHFDVGAQINYKYGTGYPGFNVPYEYYDIYYNLFGLKALVDYNICPSRLASPYVGFGLGAGYNHSTASERGKSGNFYGTLCPRAGVAIWRFRLSAGVDFAWLRNAFGRLVGDSESTSWTLSLGFSF